MDVVRQFNLRLLQADYGPLFRGEVKDDLSVHHLISIAICQVDSIDNGRLLRIAPILQQPRKTQCPDSQRPSRSGSEREGEKGSERSNL